jgi:hypothetical protein
MDPGDPKDIKNMIIPSTASKDAGVAVLEPNEPQDGEFGFSKGAQVLAQTRRVSKTDTSHGENALAGESLDEAALRKRREEAAYIAHASLYNGLAAFVGNAYQVAKEVADRSEAGYLSRDVAIGQAAAQMGTILQKYEEAGTPLMMAHMLEPSVLKDGSVSAIYRDETGNGYYVVGRDGVRLDVTAAVQEKMAANPNVKYTFVNDIAPEDASKLIAATNTMNSNLTVSVQNAQAHEAYTTIRDRLGVLEEEASKGREDGTLTEERAREIEREVTSLKEKQEEVRKLEEEAKDTKEGSLERKIIDDKISAITKEVQQNIPTGAPTVSVTHSVEQHKDSIAKYVGDFGTHTGRSMTEAEFREIVTAHKVPEQGIELVRAELAKNSTVAKYLPSGDDTAATQAAEGPAPAPNKDLEIWAAEGPRIIEQYTRYGGTDAQGNKIISSDEVNQIAEDLGINPTVVENGMRMSDFTVSPINPPAPAADAVTFDGDVSPQVVSAAPVAAAPSTGQPQPIVQNNRGMRPA